MGFHTRTADDMTNRRNVKALERKSLCRMHTQFPSDNQMPNRCTGCQSDALVANQTHYKTRPGHGLATRYEEESTPAWTRPNTSFLAARVGHVMVGVCVKIKKPLIPPSGCLLWSRRTVSRTVPPCGYLAGRLRERELLGTRPCSAHCPPQGQLL
jgi:hypothetical protein